MIAIRQQLRWQLLEMRWWSVDKYIDVDEKKDEEWKEEKYLKKKQEEIRKEKVAPHEGRKINKEIISNKAIEGNP